jgi:DoxX-like protein
VSARLGWLLGGLAIAFLVFDGAIKLFPIAPVTDSFTQLGYPVGLAPAIGALELVIVALYAVPGTSVLGAILLTGLLGGAIASQLRIGSPLFSHTLFGAYVGTIAWGGLYLREARLRELLLTARR